MYDKSLVQIGAKLSRIKVVIVSSMSVSDRHTDGQAQSGHNEDPKN